MTREFVCVRASVPLVTVEQIEGFSIILLVYTQHLYF